MTADGELFITEDICDYVSDKDEKLRKLLKDGGYIDGSEYSDIWDLSQMPSCGEANVCDEEENSVGTLLYKLKFNIVDGPYGQRTIEPEIEDAFIDWTIKR